jgi:hypothetical protein
MEWSSAEFSKSSFSGPNGCVEVAIRPDSVAVRDAKHQEGPVLEFSPGEWAAFLQGVKNGEFDLES